MVFELKDSDLFVFSKQRDSLRLTLKWALLILVFLSPWGGCMSYLSSARVQKNSSRKAPTAQESLSVSKCLAGLPRTPVAVWKGRLAAALEGAAALFKVSQCLTHLPHPLGHDVGAGGAVVRVDDDDGDDDGCDHKHHGEQHVLPNQGHGAGGGRDQLHDDQKEHGQGQQDRDAEGHLLSWMK